MTLDHAHQQNNLKIRGFPEEVGEDDDLADVMSDWLASELHLDSHSSIIITKAFRIGAKVSPHREGPRDVILTLLNVQWKKRILAEARSRCFFKFKSQGGPTKTL